MDIANMHPFCLPFGLCHDATSSAVEVSTVQNSSSGNSKQENLKSINNNNEGERSRAKSSSPSQEPFSRHLSSAPSSPFNQRPSLLDQDQDDDCDLISSSLLDHQVGSFYSLELDDIEDELGTEDELRASSAADLDEGSFGEPEDELAELLKGGQQAVDASSEWYCSQYQSLFSPSPPSPQQPQLASPHSNGTHLGHCYHINNNQLQTSTCLAVAPFRRKQPEQAKQYSHCCHNNNIITSNNTLAASNNSLLTTAVQAARGQQDPQQLQLGRSRLNPKSRQAELESAGCPFGLRQAGGKRAVSPALVTSSSSPLSQSTGPAQPGAPENRHIDNKLKENIDYLTSLFCPPAAGQLGPGSQNQLNGCHSMASPYATLSKSLSTGPKLLERPAGQLLQLSRQQPQQPGQPQEQQLSFAPPNEAQPHKRAYAAHQTDWQPYPKMAAGLAPSKSVESSVSAADSTGSDQFSELKVLSSLLTSNKQQQHRQPALNLGPQASVGWQPQAQQPANPCEQTDKPNGKPITLTPIASSGLNLLSSAQQASGGLTQKELFAQPVQALEFQQTVHNQAHNQKRRPAALLQTVAPQTNFRLTNNNNASTPNQNKRPKSPGRSNRPNSLSTECSVSSHEDNLSSQLDQEEPSGAGESDSEEDVDSDDESFYGDYTNSDLIGASISDDAENKWTLNMGRTRRNGQKRYFWQYNVQSKGPKGTRICSTDDSQNPFVLPEASDPVFSNDCQIEGVKHSGKARRGDGNDLTPNPKKLLMIGLELKKLGKIINELAPVTDLPINARNKTRKEKNKLASRACRLKKKAQHEANKIKLYGLQREHQQIVLAIYDVRKLLKETLATPQAWTLEPCENRASRKEVNSSVKTIAGQCNMSVAGQTSDYVNSVLEKVVSGCIDGGLQTT